MQAAAAVLAVADPLGAMGRGRGLGAGAGIDAGGVGAGCSGGAMAGASGAAAVGLGWPCAFFPPGPQLHPAWAGVPAAPSSGDAAHSSMCATDTHPSTLSIGLSPYKSAAPWPCGGSASCPAMAAACSADPLPPRGAAAGPGSAMPCTAPHPTHRHDRIEHEWPPHPPDAITAVSSTPGTPAAGAPTPGSHAPTPDSHAPSRQPAHGGATYGGLSMGGLSLPALSLGSPAAAPRDAAETAETAEPSRAPAAAAGRGGPAGSTSLTGRPQLVHPLAGGAQCESPAGSSYSNADGSFCSYCSDSFC